MTKKQNKNLVKIVSVLSDGEYHDGTSIGEALGMTRSAVWKTIKKLQGYNIPIDSIKGTGYAMQQPLILLDADKIKKNLPKRKWDIHVFESMASTNEYLKQAKHSDAIKICLAEQQTQGKGRLKREWYSPFGQNIYFSCLYTLHKDISELSGLGLVISLAILATLKKFGINKNIFVKWPNDIVCENKKISGSLIEIQAESHGLSHAIIGIGINVNMLDDDSNISQAWTSMQKILGEHVDRNDVCARLIENLVSYLQKFEDEGFTGFAHEWMKSDCLIDKTITLKNVNEKISGKVAGVNEHGHLLMRLTNGTVRSFSSGDTSIVKKPF